MLQPQVIRWAAASWDSSCPTVELCHGSKQPDPTHEEPRQPHSDQLPLFLLPTPEKAEVDSVFGSRTGPAVSCPVQVRYQEPSVLDHKTENAD